MSRDCCIVGAGDFTPARFCIEPLTYMIAADGGYSYLQKIGITPDIIIGDLDSLDFLPKHENIMTLEREKDDTDTMQAVKHGLKLGFDRFLIFGALGGRLDHTIANIQTLVYISRHGARGFLVGEDSVVTAVTNGSLKFAPDCKGTISVFSCAEKAQGVYLEGLKYPLADAVLTFDMPLGVSNEFTGRPARVSVDRGSLAVVFSGNYWDCLD